MKNIGLLLTISTLSIFCFLFFASCAGSEDAPQNDLTESVSPYSDSETEKGETEDAENKERYNMRMKINDSYVTVKWENNDSARALWELCKNRPLTIKTSMYGGFEQVGSIGESLPSDDKKTTTEAGDIVLYSGNQIVVFYGSNSWEYTRLGKITDKSPDELTKLLSNKNATIVISSEG